MPAGMGPLSLRATTAMDGAVLRVEMWLGPGASATAAFRGRHLHVCRVMDPCQPVSVSATSTTSHLRIRVNASDHSFVGECAEQSCRAVRPPRSGEPDVLLAILHAGMPAGRASSAPAGGSLGMVCLGEGWLVPENGGELEPLIHGPLCTPIVAPNAVASSSVSTSDLHNTSRQGSFQRYPRGEPDSVRSGRHRGGKRRGGRRARSAVAAAPTRSIRVQVLILSSPGETNRRCAACPRAAAIWLPAYLSWPLSLSSG